jgi:hypothetical protein
LELIERVFNVPEGQAHYNERAMFGSGTWRTLPLWIPMVYTTFWVNLAYVRFNNRTPRRWRASWIPILFTTWVWNNAAGMVSREKHFLMDYWKNNSFAIDEIKRLRDEQRVRQAMYESEFQYDPVAEYRLKEWLHANKSH